MQDKQFLSPNEIASELSVSASTVLRLIHEQRLPAIYVSERIYRVPVAAFEKYKAGTLESRSPARVASQLSKSLGSEPVSPRARRLRRKVSTSASSAVHILLTSLLERDATPRAATRSSTRRVDTTVRG